MAWWSECCYLPDCWRAHLLAITAEVLLAAVVQLPVGLARTRLRETCRRAWRGSIVVVVVVARWMVEWIERGKKFVLFEGVGSRIYGRAWLVLQLLLLLACPWATPPPGAYVGCGGWEGPVWEEWGWRSEGAAVMGERSRIELGSEAGEDLGPCQSTSGLGDVAISNWAMSKCIRQGGAHY